MANILTKKKQEIIVDLPYYDLDGYFNDFKVRSKYLYKIRTKDGKIVNYEPWEPQLVVDEIINQEIERTTRELGHVEVKLIYLKARQEGLSTDTTCRMSDLMLTHDNYNVQVLAHDRDGTETIYRQYRTLFNNLPHFVRVVDEKNRPIINNGAEWLMPVKPEGEPTNKQIMYKNMTHSYLGIQTAGKGDQGGKGGAINAVHYSENANYERHNDIISSTNQMIGGSHIFGVKESTANGVSGIGAGFYEDWVSESKAWKLYKEGKVSTFEGWRPVFIPWYWLMKYRKPLYQGKKIDISAVKWRSDKERREYLEWEELVENEIIPNDPYVDHESYDLRESTNFYRYVIIAKSQKELLRARRYYPTTPDEAFLTSDDCYFNTNHLHHVDIELEKKIEMPYLIGEITYKNEFEPTKTGELKLLKPPQKHWRHRYVLSCDQSKGYEGGDYSSITGFDRLEREFVMHWEGLIDEVELTDVYLRLLYYYNYALAVPESNRATMITLMKPDGRMRYRGDLYYQIKSRTSNSEPNWGYSNQSGSRNRMLELYKAFLNGEVDYGTDKKKYGNYDLLFHARMIKEHKKFIRNANGTTTKYEAAPGEKDDIVISNGLCLIGDEWWTKSPKEDRRHQKRQKHYANVVNLGKSHHKNFDHERHAHGLRQSKLGQNGKTTRSRVIYQLGGRQSKVGKK